MKNGDTLLGLIGNTPLVRIKRILPGKSVKIMAKLEYLIRADRSKTGWLWL